VSLEGAEMPQGQPPPAAAQVGRGLGLIAVGLCVVGLVVAGELTRIHVFVHTDPDYHSVCAVSEGVNCETVASSPFSVFAGLPVSVWGLLGYLVMGVLAAWASGRRRPHPAWPWGILSTLAGFSVLVSIVLAWIAATRIDSLCLFCMGSYAISAALLGVSLVALRRSRSSLVRLVLLDAKALRARPGLAAAGLVLLLGIVAALMVSVPVYWKAPGWSELPRLETGTDAEGHHWIGAREPGLTIVEFSDYECPHCREAHKQVRALAARYPERVRLVHRHLPLDQACHPALRRPFHRHACRFAEAAECAGLQGRFWEMNDALFSVQEKVAPDAVEPVELAVRLGLDRSEFVRCLEAHATRERVRLDVQEAVARGLRGTPSFLVGEQLFLGRISEPQLEQLLQQAPR
jgi:uncharacterized membrane protein/predicted DsbA family dithiol-disulfide isomerase